MTFIQSVYGYIWLSSLKSKVVFFLGVVLLAEKVLFQCRTGCSKFQVPCEGSVSSGHLNASPDAGECDGHVMGIKGQSDIIFHININVSSL